MTHLLFMSSCNDSHQSGPFHYYFVILFTYCPTCPSLLLLPYNFSIAMVFYLTPHPSDPLLPLTGSFSYIIFAISFHCLSLHFPFTKILFFCSLASSFLSAPLYHPLSCSLSSSCSTYLCVSVLSRPASLSFLPLS